MPQWLKVATSGVVAFGTVFGAVLTASPKGPMDILLATIAGAVAAANAIGNLYVEKPNTKGGDPK